MRAWKDKKYILPSLLGRGWGVGLLLLLLLTACHDDDGPDMIGPEAAAWTVDVLGGGAVETDDEGNAKEDLYVGYGYDIFKALDNPMSVRTKTPIIDLDKLRAAGSAAANSLETSKADVFDQQMGVFLSNAFARTFRRIINDNPAVPIYDLYRQLSRTTNGSHVTLYNENQYGSVYTSTMDDFFPE